MLSTLFRLLQFFFKFVSSSFTGLHEDREAALRDHVLQSAKDGDPESVLQTIDAYCWNRSWMMHVGDEKRVFVEQALKQAGTVHFALELGLYCGYSATTIARQLASNGKLYTIEPQAKHCDIASAILQKAGLRDKVQIVPGRACDVLDDLAKQDLIFDFVFIDHEKSQYYNDLKLLEDKGLLREGTVVVADNVVMFDAKEYLAHVRNSGLYTSSVLHKAHVEYNRAIPDGVEVSVYRGRKSEEVHMQEKNLDKLSP